jgi:DNA-binding protein
MKKNKMNSNKEEAKQEIKINEKIQEKKEDNIIFVGLKPFMNYVTALTMSLQNKKHKNVIVCARGKFVSKAVDIVEVAKRNLLKEENIKIEKIEISSERLSNKEGKQIFVSSISIILSRGERGE